MYSVYLIDDEPLILETMQNTIPWQEHDLIVIGSNSDPSAAIKEIEKLRPEAVFTDIKMPNITGIELVEKLKSKNIDAEYIVISAHENFSYARELIQLGAFDYLIKPVEEKQYTELLSRLLQRLEKKHPHRNTKKTSSVELNNILLFLNKEIDKKYSLKDIAAKFSISSNYVCNLFSKHLGITFSAYCTQIRMSNAKRLLKNTDKPVKEISAMCGYDDYFYFCRVFRDYFSCTPTQMRSNDED